MTHILTYECPPGVHKQKCGLLMKDNRCNVERIAELEKTEAEFRFFLEIHDEVPAFAKKMRELESELAQLRNDNQELRNRIESIETKTEELHLAVYGYGTAHDSAEYVLDNLLIDGDKVKSIVNRVKELKADNQSLVQQVNQAAKKIDELKAELNRGVTNDL